MSDTNEGPLAARTNTSIPIKDPTERTIEQMLREVANLSDKVNLQLDALKDVIDEKFSSVNKTLALVERQRVEQKADTKSAVDAALTAQKEAVREQTTASELAIAKSENAIKEQLAQLTVTFNTANAAQTAALHDLKERFTASLGAEEGARGRTTDTKSNMTLIIAGITGFIGLAALIVAIVVNLTS